MLDMLDLENSPALNGLSCLETLLATTVKELAMNLLMGVGCWIGCSQFT